MFVQKRVKPIKNDEYWFTLWLIGRPGRIQSLIKFLDYIQNFKDIWICKRNEIAEHWYKIINKTDIENINKMSDDIL